MDFLAVNKACLLAKQSYPKKLENDIHCFDSITSCYMGWSLQTLQRFLVFSPIHKVMPLFMAQAAYSSPMKVLEQNVSQLQMLQIIQQKRYDGYKHRNLNANDWFFNMTSCTMLMTIWFFIWVSMLTIWFFIWFSMFLRLPGNQFSGPNYHMVVIFYVKKKANNHIGRISAKKIQYQVLKWLQVLSCLLLCNDGLQKPNQYLVLHRNLCSQGPDLVDTMASSLFVKFTIAYPLLPPSPLSPSSHSSQWPIND